MQAIIGLGATGLSCARYLAQRGLPIMMLDTRQSPPTAAEFQHEFPNVPCYFGPLDAALLARATRLLVSPGVSLQEPAIAHCLAKKIPVIGDIELFAQEAKAPIIAITGTNAKSTVTTLVGEMAKQAGLIAGVGGNLGTPALDLLAIPHPDLFVLELSSFQLETTYSLAANVATILNVTPDHMDRYATVEDYCNAKQRIYTHCKIAVVNRDDPLTWCASPTTRKLFFTLQSPQSDEFGLTEKDHEMYLAFGDTLLLPVAKLPILGRHYQANALAALALGHGYGIPMDAMLKTLTEFKGLQHRCQLVRERKGVCWYNDSKGTNVGATLAAIEGLGAVISGKLILIAGGVGKNADFNSLVEPIARYVKTVILIGEAAPLLSATIGNRAPVCFAKSMAEAVNLADQIANPNDSVLLSPACASFDMFKNFEHRGNVFTEIVQALI